jgi:hypothetical protein
MKSQNKKQEAKRIQRKRTPDWRKPRGAVYVGRGSRWGNPYRIGEEDPMFLNQLMDAEAAVRMYEWYLAATPELVAAIKTELRGKVLACWCPLDQPCHADVLLRIANEGLTQ